MRFNDRMTSCMCRVDGLPRGAEQGKTDLHVEPLVYAPLADIFAMAPQIRHVEVKIEAKLAPGRPHGSVTVPFTRLPIFDG